MSQIPGIEPANVTTWLAERVPALDAPLRFDIVAAGRSNLTFIVTDAAERRWVLRRPPTGHLLASAHDMSREHRAISALRDSEVPVPRIIGFCEDTAVTGAQFFVMEFVEGFIIRGATAPAGLAREAKARIGPNLVDTLVKLHAVDPDDVGLGDLGRKEGYVGRQLKRWLGQIQQGSDRSIPRLAEIHDELERRMPEQQGAGIVHGDYRLDNCLISGEGQVNAVLDWELCTLGDVLADVAMLLMYSGWRRGGGAGPTPLGDARVLDPNEMLELYTKHSERDLSQLPYYVAFTNWRLACIMEGVRVRFERGAMGKDIGAELAGYRRQIDGYLEIAGSLLS